jgi:hypothetical protein
MNVNWTMLKESWNTIQHAFTGFGPRILVCFLISIGIYAIGKLMKAWVVSRRKAVLRNPDIQFLEGALDDDAPRKGNPNYSYAEFQRDLHDKGLTFEEIYEKCGGVFPKKPEQGLYGPQGYQGPMETPEHRPGLHGPSGAPGFQGFQGADGRCPDRMSELQVWFKERGKTSHVGGLVPPPPNPYPIVHKIYIRGRR